MKKNSLINIFFKKKTIEEINTQTFKNFKLKKSLSLIQIISLGIGVLVGGGIFVVTGMASALHTGPAITISFLLCGFMCVCAGLCYAEFASVIKNSGSSYSYIYITFGKFPAWIIGSFSIIGYLLGSVSVIVGWSNYILDFIIYINFPSLNNFFLYDQLLFPISDFFALFICLISTFILYQGIKLSSIITNISVFIKLLVLLCFILIGIFYVDINNWIPYIPSNTGNFGEYGYSGIFAGISIIFLAFNGFDAICSAAQEVKNPTTNIPIAIISTIIIITFLYIFTSAVITGLVPYQDLNVPQVIAIAMKNINIRWIIYFMKVGTILGLTSVIIISQYTIIRMLLVIINDNFRTNFLTKIHNNNYVPHNLTILVGILMFFLSISTKIQNIVKLSSILILTTVFFICLASLFNRYYLKSYRKFVCPYMPFPPLFFIILSLYIFYSYSIQVYIFIFFLFIFLSIFYIINVFFFQRD